MKFAWIDIVLFAGLCLAIVLGYRGGITKKLLNILALIAAIVIAAQLMRPIGDFLVENFFFSPHAGYISGFVFVVVGIMTATILLYKKYTRAGMAKAVSQGVGVVLGALEGAVVISLVLLMLKVFGFPASSTREDSLLYKPLVNFAPNFFDMLRPYLPGAGDVRQELARAFEKVDIFDVGIEVKKK
jgi:uncharacterized membrane protein required for colicin V production